VALELLTSPWGCAGGTAESYSLLYGPADTRRRVLIREDQKVVRHPAVGPTTVDCDVLTNGDAGLKIVILAAAAGSEDANKLQLAVLSGVRSPAQG
jgi:hypothetical protein